MFIVEENKKFSMLLNFYTYCILRQYSFVYNIGIKIRFEIPKNFDYKQSIFFLELESHIKP